MTLPFISTLTVLLQSSTGLSLSLSSAAALFTSPTLNAAKSSIPLGRIKRQLQAWWSPEVEEAVSERRKAFVAAHRSDENRQTYISSSRHTSSIIAKAMAWQATCSSLSPKSDYGLCSFSFVLPLALLSHLPPPLTSPTDPLPGRRLRFSPTI